jgi:hypothetical protein
MVNLVPTVRRNLVLVPQSDLGRIDRRRLDMCGREVRRDCLGVVRPGMRWYAAGLETMRRVDFSAELDCGKRKLG